MTEKIKQNVLEYIESTLLKAINEDLVQTMKYYEKKGCGGYFSIPREVFCYIDFLGLLITGNKKDSGNRSKEFLKRYMAKVNPRYGKAASIIHLMWRNGTVHEFDPKIFYNKIDSFELGWSANNNSKDHNRKWHLCCLANKNVQNSYHLHINLFQLIDDLKDAIYILVKEAKNDSDFFQVIQHNFECASEQFELKNNNLLEAREIIADTQAIIQNGSVEKEFKSKEEFEKFRATW